MSTCDYKVNANCTGTLVMAGVLSGLMGTLVDAQLALVNHLLMVFQGFPIKYSEPPFPGLPESTCRVVFPASTDSRFFLPPSKIGYHRMHAAHPPPSSSPQPRNCGNADVTTMLTPPLQPLEHLEQQRCRTGWLIPTDP